MRIEKIGIPVSEVLILKILRIFPNRTLAQNNNLHLTWDCSIIRAPMRMKIVMGFVHMLIIMKILVVLCALSFVLFCNLFKPCSICRIL